MRAMVLQKGSCLLVWFKPPRLESILYADPGFMNAGTAERSASGAGAASLHVLRAGIILTQRAVQDALQHTFLSAETEGRTQGKKNTCVRPRIHGNDKIQPVTQSEDVVKRNKLTKGTTPPPHGFHITKGAIAKERALFPSLPTLMEKTQSRF